MIIYFQLQTGFVNTVINEERQESYIPLASPLKWKHAAFQGQLASIIHSQSGLNLPRFPSGTFPIWSPEEHMSVEITGNQSVTVSQKTRALIANSLTTLLVEGSTKCSK